MKKINFIEKSETNAGEVIFSREEERKHAVDLKVDDESKKVECLEEIKSKREKYAKHYRMSDGSIRAVYYGTPVHYYDVDSKQYEEIDNELEYIDKSIEEQDFEGYQNKRGETKVKFAKQIGESHLMQINKGGHKIIWRLLGQKQEHSSKREISDYGRVENVCAAVHNAKNSDIEKKAIHKKNALINNLVQSYGEIRYNDFVKGADLQYFTKSSQLKENIIIKEQLDNYEFAFELRLKE